LRIVTAIGNGNGNKIFTVKRHVQMENNPRSPWFHTCAQRLLAS
jgi:hypothetical protein